MNDFINILILSTLAGLATGIGVLIAIGITLHNIPAGIAVGAGYLHVQ